MKLGLYAVLDRKLGSFARPFVMNNDGMAVRAFLTAKQDPSSEMSKYPEDFSLYALGTFDDESGTLAQPTPPQALSEV